MKLSKLISCSMMGVVLFAADALLKAYVCFYIPSMHLSQPLYPYGGIGVFRDWHGIDFSITHVMNKGAAWGMFSGIQEYLLYARVLIIGGLLSYLLFVKTTGYRKCCLTMIAAGALGNVIDTFVYGHVIDMFYFIFWGYSFPVFNLADSAIFTGIVLLLTESLWLKIRGGSSKKSAREPA